MPRQPSRMDALLALVMGAEMQIELLFLDAPGDDLLIAHAALLVLAGALLVRRSAPVVAAAVGLGVLVVLERIGGPVDSDLVGPFFVMLAICFSVGAHTEGRELAAGIAVLVVGTVVAIRLDRPPRPCRAAPG